MDELAQNIIIPIKGMTKGSHSFNYVIDGKFFQIFGNTQIKDADCSVKADVVRHSTLMSVVCHIGGFVVVECDRCLDDLVLKVDVDRELTVGFGSVDLDDSIDEDDVLVIGETDGEADISQFVYDYICLSLPIMKVHPDGKCNPEMMKRLETQSDDSSEAADSPFSALKDMLNE